MGDLGSYVKGQNGPDEKAPPTLAPESQIELAERAAETQNFMEQLQNILNARILKMFIKTCQKHSHLCWVAYRE